MSGNRTILGGAAAIFALWWWHTSHPVNGRPDKEKSRAERYHTEDAPESLRNEAWETNDLLTREDNTQWGGVANSKMIAPSRFMVTGDLNLQ